MLLSGDLDAIISARPPRPFIEKDERIARLFPDAFNDELSYWKDTGIFPIMHTVVMRREIYEANRWVALELYKAFQEAKRRSLARIKDVTASLIAIPWLAHHVAKAEQMMGEDFWPYGVEKNRTTLDAFLRHAHEQGVCHRQLAVEELFAPEALDLSRT